jgi:mono/diheme cytochrome c family protein
MSRSVPSRARGLWPWAFVVFAVFTATLVARASIVPQTRTVKDKVYTKEQAARGEASFTKNCATCHLLADRKPSDPVGNNDAPSLGGPAFLTKWDGKSVFELTSGMRLSMPPDGSINLSEDDAADIAAYLIKVNGFPEGDKPLKADTSARTLMWVKPSQAHADAALTPIADAAAATLVIPGSADFLVADDDAVWITNRGRLEKLVRNEPAPVASVVMPRPCGAPAVGFGAVWVANCTDRSLYRIDRSTATVTATIATGLADRSGELSVAAGAGSVWVLSDAAGVLSRIDPQTNQVTAKIPVAPNSFAAVFDFGAVWVTNARANRLQQSARTGHRP